MHKYPVLTFCICKGSGVVIVLILNSDLESNKEIRMITTLSLHIRISNNHFFVNNMVGR